MPQPLRYPYFRLYTRDWLAGQGTSAMTAEQEGAFIRLLCHAWESHPPCTLPNDDVRLAAWSKLGARWKTCGRLVKQQFKPTRGRRLKNPKQWLVYTDIERQRKERSKAGKKGAKAKTKRAKRKRK